MSYEEDNEVNKILGRVGEKARAKNRKMTVGAVVDNILER